MEANQRSAAAPPAAADIARAGTGTLGLYAAAVFVAAALVFAVQPMVAKMLLPTYGGAPAVWAVSLVFFQVVLLGGYAFAHFSIRLAGVRRQPIVQLVLLLLPLLALPIATSAETGGSGSTQFQVLAALTAAAALPFFAVSTASPVLQRWFSASGHRSSADPYFLYAAGNAGSLLGLLAYPTLIEPRFSLEEQASLWSGAYVVFVLLAALCAWRVFATPAPAPAVASIAVGGRGAALSMRTRVRWIAMAAIPSSLMVGATTHMSTDVAAVPLLWVIPLALYLLSFVAAFSQRTLVSQRVLGALVAASAIAVVASLIVALPIAAVIVIHNANLFFVALLVHRRLSHERPPAERLTEFYLLLSVGGAIGGALTALAAPALLTRTAEYPLAIVLALLLRPGPFRAPRSVGLLRRQADLLMPLALLGAIAVAVIAIPRDAGSGALRGVLLAAAVATVVFARRPLRFALGIGVLLLLVAGPAPSLYTERTFFGVSRVVEDGDHHWLMHGTTLHGLQDFRPGRRDEPLGYFTRTGPLGQLFDALDGRADRVGVIGLGTGSIAAYGERGDEFTFYEIDDAVARIASDRRWFTYLDESDASVRIVLGDGRIRLAEAPDRSYDVIILDAFSSDAIPVHLLTQEALEIYVAKLAPGGVVALHLTNRHLDLVRVAAGTAAATGLEGVTQAHAVTQAQLDRGITPSRWVVLARDDSALEALRRDSRWSDLATVEDPIVWTDQSSNVVGVLSWRRR